MAPKKTSLTEEQTLEPRCNQPKNKKIKKTGNKNKNNKKITAGVAKLKKRITKTFKTG